MISREIEELIGAYWDCAYQEGHLRRPDGNKANKILHDLRRAIEAECRVPDGWQLVPMEPTAEQMEAVINRYCHYNDAVRDEYRTYNIERLRHDYIAAVAAAPKPAEPVAQEPVGEIVAFGKSLHEVAWRKGKMPSLGSKLYLCPLPDQSAEAQREINMALDLDDARERIAELERQQAGLVEAVEYYADAGGVIAKKALASVKESK